MSATPRELEEFTRKAKNTIASVIYVTIATVDANANPWNSPVFCAYDESYRFFWASHTENQHSKNIVQNHKAFVVFYNSTVPEGTGMGVYMEGEARMLTESDFSDIDMATRLLAARKNGTPHPAREFLGEYPRRIFCFVPTKVWVNGRGQVNGSFVDRRIDITGSLLKH